MELNTKIRTGTQDISKRILLRAFLILLEELKQEWTGESMEDYIKFLLGDRVSQFRSKDGN